MADFAYTHKVVVRMCAFTTFSSVQNGGELKFGAESEGLQCQFLQVEGDLDLQKISKLIPIPKKRILRKKAIMMKNEDEKREGGYDEDED